MAFRLWLVRLGFLERVCIFTSLAKYLSVETIFNIEMRVRVSFCLGVKLVDNAFLST